MGSIFGRKRSHTDGDNAAVFGNPNKNQQEEKKDEEKVQNEQTRKQERQSVQEREPQKEQQAGNSKLEGESQQKEEPQEKQNEKKDKLANRFNNRADLIDGIANMGEELGKEIDPEKVQQTDTEELEEVYEELISEYGKTSDVKETRKENQQLKDQIRQYENEISSMKNQINQITGYLKQTQQNKQARPQQNMQQRPNQQQMGQSQTGQPVRDPNTGQFVKRNQQGNQQANQQNQQNQQNNQQENVDPDEWLREFYKNPVQAVQKISNMNQQQQQEIKQNMNQEQKQDFREQQRQLEQQKRQQYRKRLEQTQNKHFRAKKQEMIDKYGDDFDNPGTKKKVLDFMRKHPIYLNPNIFPNGIEIAYNSVTQNQTKQKQQQESQGNTEDITTQKRAAQLPKSQGSSYMSKEGNQNEDLKNKLFKTNSGIFGRK